MADTTIANTTPKFYFKDKAGRQYGARFLTIHEQVKCKIEVERVSNGHISDWKKSSSDDDVAMANMLEFAAALNKVIVVWPDDVTPVADFVESDDLDQLLELWEAYGAAANTFREARKPQSGSVAVAGGASA